MAVGVVGCWLLGLVFCGWLVGGFGLWKVWLLVVGWCWLLLVVRCLWLLVLFAMLVVVVGIVTGGWFVGWLFAVVGCAWLLKC